MKENSHASSSEIQMGTIETAVLQVTSELQAV